MNFYQRHLGDYSKNASYLSLRGHGIYVRLIDIYYTKEAPIPEDKAARWIGAATEPEMQELQLVLQEFFVLRDGHWHQDRCDAEIAAYVEGEPEREVKRANEDNRLKRHRDERSALFRVLVDAGRHAPWNIGMGELRKLAAECVAGVAVSENSNGPATATATPATATHYPLPITHLPLKKKEISSLRDSSPGGDPTDAKSKVPNCPYGAIVDAYHTALPELPAVKLVDNERRKTAMRRLWRWVFTSRKVDGTTRADTPESALGWIQGYFVRASQNDFIMGRSGRAAGHENWRADFDYLLSDKGLKQVIEKTRIAA